jgi:hypothetical protein
MPGKNDVRKKVASLALKTGLALSVPDGYGRPCVHITFDGTSMQLLPHLPSGELLKRLEAFEIGFEKGFTKGLVEATKHQLAAMEVGAP